MICLEAPVDPIELPCKHSYCRGCVAQLREKGVSQSCPLCRAPLPPGAEQLFDMGYRVWARLKRAVGSNGGRVWAKLSSEQQSEMDGAILMLEEAMAQVRRGVLGSEGLGCYTLSWRCEVPQICHVFTLLWSARLTPRTQ